MRIISANIPPQANRTSPTNSPAGDKTRSQTNEARDSYNKNRGAQIIDAEYVEFYNPDIKHFNNERQKLDSTLEPDRDGFDIPATEGANKNPAVKKYQLKAQDAPPPGSFLDTFA